MSKRKYAKNVSPIVKTWAFGGELCHYARPELSFDNKPTPEAIMVPVRIVRESFYRKIIKAYKEKNK